LFWIYTVTEHKLYHISFAIIYECVNFLSANFRSYLLTYLLAYLVRPNQPNGYLLFGSDN